MCSVGFVYSGYTGMEILQISQKFRVRYTNVVPVPTPAPGYFYKGIPVPRVLCHRRTELTKVEGMGMNVAQTGKYPGYGPVRTLQNNAFFRVRV